MNFHLTTNKKAVDKIRPLSFLAFLENEKVFNIFIEALYPSTYNGFFKKQNGEYSFYFCSGYINPFGELIDSDEEYNGSIYDDLTDLFYYYLKEVQRILEIRKIEHLYESRKIDDSYILVMVAELDATISRIDFIRDVQTKDLICLNLRKLKDLFLEFLPKKIISAIITHPNVSQNSYFLGDIMKMDIEKIYKIAEEDFLIDIDVTNLETFVRVFSANEVKSISESVIFERNISKITAFFYSLSLAYPSYSHNKVGESQAFYYHSKKGPLQLITENGLYANYSRKKNMVQFSTQLRKYEQAMR